nr:MAG TPA: hypothetical protein [Inoviridae sp.]
MPFRGSAAAKPLRRPPQIQGKGKKMIAYIVLFLI